MTLNAALWASSTALTGKAALALWFASLLFLLCDSRRITRGWLLVLSLAAMLLSITAGMHCDTAICKWSWIISAACGCVATLLHMKSWTRTSPSETFEEVSQVDAPLKKKKKAARAASSSKTTNANSNSDSLAQWSSLASWLSASGAVAAALATVSATQVVARPFSLVSSLHLLAVCTLLAVAVFCALELTFGSAPKSLAAVAWSRVAGVAILAWLLEAFVALAIVIAPVDEAAPFQTVALTRLFAISILVIDFVVWMIPQRVAHFKRTGKSDAWVSLALAAWIGLLCQLVLCALPSTWPWKL